MLAYIYEYDKEEIYIDWCIENMGEKGTDFIEMIKQLRKL